MTSSQSTADVAGLLDRYLINLDDDKLDDAWARGLFTEDAVVEFPMSRHEGITGLAEYHSTALAAFARTQHINSPAVVEIDGDQASLRANIVSTHVHHPSDHPEDADRDPIFANGSLVSAKARRTPDGWRLSLLSLRMIWVTGTPPRKG